MTTPTNEARVQEVLELASRLIQECRTGDLTTIGMVWDFLESALRSLAASATQVPHKPCEYCDDTGDVHGRDGEWRGVCSCPAGQQFRAPQAATQVPRNLTDADIDEIAASNLGDYKEGTWHRVFARAVLGASLPTPQAATQGEAVAKEAEPAPSNSLPSWSECQLRVANSDFIEKRVREGGYGADQDSKLATQLHRFIYEYDDADPYRSAWFLHRLELLLNETRALTILNEPAPAPSKEQTNG